MAYMRIHCGDCGMVKEVHKYVPDDTEVRYCPLCGSEIDRDIWETMIIPAVELLNKANRAFIAKPVCNHRCYLLSVDISGFH